ncbi:hypothetical protein AJ80_03133 [Polytolypa hystricis UAMH7299]|uniref:Prokaryotic-type class I peptide chain release factors domain-containing protein n=1 Tax=Polytolypa hystricis (strain UAMH7299) TaxID=1447883 RepID=A0A2B7YKN0_POLH7|nr:hypothetical protein AJ80_03133 [Polytolypa hystricis UAMH7299]
MLASITRYTKAVNPFHFSSSCRLFCWQSKLFSSRQVPPVSAALTETELSTARNWLAKLTINTIPRNVGDASYSRSSGPGGQNVNKVNSKATLKVPLDRLTKIVPLALHNELRASRYHAERSGNLVIQSDESRQQSKNLDLCYEKLRDVLLAAGKTAVPGETSPEQRQRVKELNKAGNEARLKEKKKHSSKKSNRKGSRFDD